MAPLHSLLLLSFLALSHLVATSPFDLFSHGRFVQGDVNKISSVPFDYTERHTLDARARKKPPPPPPPPTYGKLQTDGENVIAWLKDPKKYLNDPSCKVNPSMVTYQTLEDEGWKLSSTETSFPFDVWSMVKELGLPEKKDYMAVEAQIEASNPEELNVYENRVGPGVIFALSNSRVDNHPWSEIAGAIYQKFGSGDLKYVFRVDVTNTITETLVKTKIYPKIYPKNKWPDYEFRYWFPDSDEYAAIMGTPNGKGVGALLLGYNAELGAKTVTKITTWAEGDNGHLQILFTLG